MSGWFGSCWGNSEGSDNNFNIKNLKFVEENQTVQQVLDSITDASENNQYLVLVPSGHETEYFEWKKYVTVKFLDNLDERWQLDELEGWNNLNSWIIPSGFIASIEQTDEGDWIKLTSQTGSRYLEYAQPLDLRKYQGLLVRFKLLSRIKLILHL